MVTKNLKAYRQLKLRIQNGLAIERRQVGVPETAGVYPDGTPVVQVALFNEFGTATIPRRPFIRGTTEGHRAKYGKLLKDGITEVLNGEKTQSQLMDEVAEVAAEDVRRAIVEWKEPPNAPSTQRKKGRDDPLSDTDRLRRSVTWWEG